MNKDSPRELGIQRLALRRRLGVQRARIAAQIGPPPTAGTAAYPRSMTMRFLTRQPALVRRLLAEAAVALIGVRVVRSISASVRMLGMFRGAAAGRRERGET